MPRSRGQGCDSPDPDADRALAEAELFDEQREADSDLPAGGPGGNVHRLARGRGDPVGAVLRPARGGKASQKPRRWPAEEQRDDLASFHSITSSASESKLSQSVMPSAFPPDG